MSLYDNPYHIGKGILDFSKGKPFYERDDSGNHRIIGLDSTYADIKTPEPTVENFETERTNLTEWYFEKNSQEKRFVPGFILDCLLDHTRRDIPYHRGLLRIIHSSNIKASQNDSFGNIYCIDPKEIKICEVAHFYTRVAMREEIVKEVRDYESKRKQQRLTHKSFAGCMDAGDFAYIEEAGIGNTKLTVIASAEANTGCSFQISTWTAFPTLYFPLKDRDLVFDTAAEYLMRLVEKNFEVLDRLGATKVKKTTIPHGKYGKNMITDLLKRKI